MIQEAEFLSLAELGEEIDSNLGKACKSICEKEKFEFVIKESFKSQYYPLFICLEEYRNTKERLNDQTVDIQKEMVEMLKETINYNANKVLLKNSEKKEEVNSWIKALKETLALENQDQTQSKVEVLTNDPKFTLINNTRWILEKVIGKEDKIIELKEVSISQAINIYDSKKLTLKVSSKCKGILIESCSNCGIIATSTVSGIEIINSKNCQLQLEGYVPTISLDSCENCSIYIPENIIKEIQIITSKVSLVNIKILNENGELIKELPIHEQFKTTINNNFQLETEPLSHAAA